MPQQGFTSFWNETLVHRDIMMNIKEIYIIEPLTTEDHLTSVFITDLTILDSKLTNAEKIVFQPFNKKNILSNG